MTRPFDRKSTRPPPHVPLTSSDIAREALRTAIYVAGPALIVSMIVGLSISIFQVVTSLQDQTVAFVPKVLAVMAVVVLSFPWMVRVMVQFTIGANGQVMTSIVQSSTMGNPTVEQCIAGAVRRWEFPKPQGGIVIVTYPFVLKAADG